MATLQNAADLMSKSGWTQDQVNLYNQQLTELQQFRSYSYHHILIATQTTAAADVLFAVDTGSGGAASSPIDRFMHPSYTEKYKPIPVTTSGADAGSYVVLINGLTDAEFLIDSIEWEAIFVPDAGESNPHGSFVEGTMEIKEPMGVRFLNLMKDCCDNLKTDPSGLKFVLKTIFVGYSDGINGTPSVKQVLDVEPFTFVITDITSEFTNVGSSYTLSFVGECNGISRMPAFGQIQTSGISTSGTIGTCVQNLQQKLNDASKQAYQQIVAQLSEANNTSGNTGTQSTTPSGRMVQYQFIVDPQLSGFNLDNVNPRLLQTSTDSSLGTPQGIDIESALTDICLSSTDLMKWFNQDIKKGYKNVFKIESALDSSLTTVTVIVNIKSAKVPVTVKDNTNKEGVMIDPNIDGRPVVQFEYIYTGLNEDIIEYDMKMMMGMAFFQLYGTTNSLPGNFNSASGDIETLASGPGATLNSKTTLVRELTPLPMSAQVTDANSKNKKAAAETANFRMFMARWAFCESVSTTVRIAGIPKLLDGFNLRVSQVSQEGGQSQVEGLPLIIIHVKMPNTRDDFISGTSDYADDFWYKGKFQILSVKNSFRDGRFEQELEINAISYEEMVDPSVGGGTGTSGGSSSGTTTNNTGNKSSAPPPAVTPEQKAKHGAVAPALPPDVQFNCQNMLSQTYKTVADCAKVRLTQSFTLDQFIRRDINVTNDAHILTNLCKIANELEKVKAWFGVPVIITSGYRSPAYNATVKGSSSTSDHMKGLAVDVQFVGIEPQEAWNRLKTSPFNFRQCIWEHFGHSSWVHCAFNVDPTYPVQNTPTFFTLPS